MVEQTDYYELLQVHPAADPEVVAAAFRILARKHHPDHGGTNQRMAALNEAWAVLREPAQRAEYDRVRATPQAFSTQTTVQAEGPLASRRAGQDGSSVLDFGRYAGWSLEDIARSDPSFLAWLARTPVGRRYRDEIGTLIGRQNVAC